MARKLPRRPMFPTTTSACSMCDSSPFRHKCIGEAASFERVVRVERGVEEIIAFPVLANDEAGLVVADFDNVRFEHGFFLAGNDRHPPMMGFGKRWFRCGCSAATAP